MICEIGNVDSTHGAHRTDMPAARLAFSCKRLELRRSLSIPTTGLRIIINDLREVLTCTHKYTRRSEANGTVSRNLHIGLSKGPRPSHPLENHTFQGAFQHWVLLLPETNSMKGARDM